MDVSPSGGGIVKINQTAPSSFPATFNFSNGESVRLEAEPVSGYRFASWSEDLSGTTNPTTISIDCNKTVTANFSRITHTLTMQVSGNGTTTPIVGGHDYIDGTVVSITASPDNGWQFDSWTGDVAEPVLATTIVTVDSDKTITANFSQVRPKWWLGGGIVAGFTIIGVIVWLVVRSRTA